MNQARKHELLLQDNRTRRRSSLERAFQNLATGGRIPVTIWGQLIEQGTGSTSILAYWWTSSMDDLKQRMVAEFGDYLVTICDVALGIVTSALLTQNPEKEEWAGLQEDFDSIDELMLSPYLLATANNKMTHFVHTQISHIRAA